MLQGLLHYFAEDFLFLMISGGGGCTGQPESYEWTFMCNIMDNMPEKMSKGGEMFAAVFILLSWS